MNESSSSNRWKRRGLFGDAEDEGDDAYDPYAAPPKEPESSLLLEMKSEPNIAALAADPFKS